MNMGRTYETPNIRIVYMYKEPMFSSVKKHLSTQGILGIVIVQYIPIIITKEPLKNLFLVRV